MWLKLLVMSVFLSTASSFAFAEDETPVRIDFNKEVLQSSRPVLVEFSAVWCPPCKQAKPVLQKIKVDFAKNLKVVRVDVEANPEAATQFHITSIPTVMVFKHGRAIEEPGAIIVGWYPDQLLKLIEKYFGVNVQRDL